MSKFSITDLSLVKHDAFFVQLLLLAILVLSPGVATSASITINEVSIPTTTLNLTATGTTDWVSWVFKNSYHGTLPTDTSPYARKNKNGMPVIGDVVPFTPTAIDGHTPSLRYLGSSLMATWSDGDLNAIWSVDGENHGPSGTESGLLQICGECPTAPGGDANSDGYNLGGLGTSFTFPVTATTRTVNVLDLHVGGFRAKGKLTVTLPGGAMASKEIDFLSGGRNVTLRVEFEADDVGDVLYAEWKQTQSGVHPYNTLSGRSSNLSIIAATLAAVPDSDDDLVADNVDSCLYTAPGDTVAADGCLAGFTLSVAGLADAEAIQIFTPQLMSHAVISGAAISIAADSVVDSNLAAQAAVTIGAGLNTQTQNIYAGAAVTTGALSTVKNIFSGAAAGIGASANAQNVHAGAAITVGAGGDVQEVYAGAAITLGAGAWKSPTALAANANTFNEAPEDIRNATSMAAAIAQIGVAQDALTTLNDSTTNPPESLYTTMGSEYLSPGVYQGSALSIAANSTVEFEANNTSGVAMDHVWVINLTEALTVGAGTVFVTDVLSPDTATIIWNVGTAVTLGAGTEFLGTAFVNGAFNAATSDVSCGNIYATGAVSVGRIGALDMLASSSPIKYEPRECQTKADGGAARRGRQISLH
jgi:hypothetical protein